jgi:hypothetical protein
MGTQVSNESAILAYAIPNQWNVTYYDPYRVFLITYFIVVGDGLADSYSSCQTMMTSAQNWASSQG